MKENHLKRSDRQLTESVYVGSQDIVLSDFERLFVLLWIQEIMHFLVVDLHIRNFDLVRELGTLLFRYHIKEIVAQAWYYPFVVATAHHCVRLSGTYKDTYNARNDDIFSLLIFLNIKYVIIKFKYYNMYNYCYRNDDYC